MTTYTKAHKKYYEKNKKKIRKQKKEYHKLYNREYYKKNREAILESAKERRTRVSLEKEAFLDKLSNSCIFENPSQDQPLEIIEE